MKVAIEKTSISGIIAAIVTVLAIVILSLWQSRHLQDTAAWIKHTNQVLFQTQEVYDRCTRYELSVKNFLLTGYPSLLYSMSQDSSVSDRIADLRQLTADDPVQLQRLDSLSQYIGKNKALLDSAVTMSRSNDFQAAAKLIAAGAIIGYSRRIQSLIDRLESEERVLLDQRRKVNQRAAYELQLVLWGLIVAVAILAGVVFRKIRVDLGKEKNSREKLSRFNQVLEEQVRVQTANLRGSEKKYRMLFYKSPLPKWIYDQETLQFLEVNEAAVLHYGYSEEEFLRMRIVDIRPEEDRTALMKDVEEALAARESSRHGNWRHEKKNGEIIMVEITAHSIEYEGRSARMVVVSDITERNASDLLLRQLNEDLGKRASELAASNAELERFAYIASHDLQEPLRMVSSFLQLLQKRYAGQLDEKADQYIHYAVDGADRMKALVQDLLEYSRVGSKKESFGLVDTAGIVEEVGVIFREKIIETRARIEIDSLPRVLGDKVQLVQLFQNLVGNALKYHGPEAPVIRVSARQENGCWQFAVQDNGIGIEPRFFDKIFVIFQRLHNKGDYSGTGIGLAICKKIVERHGGKIWVVSAPQKGSAFFFTISQHH